jgi:hypothetical protein
MLLSGCTSTRGIESGNRGEAESQAENDLVSKLTRNINGVKGVTIA